MRVGFGVGIFVGFRVGNFVGRDVFLRASLAAFAIISDSHPSLLPLLHSLEVILSFSLACPLLPPERK